MNIDAKEALPLVWMLINAAWGLAELAEDGTVNEVNAKEILARLVERAMVPAARRPHRVAHGSPFARPRKGEDRAGRRKRRNNVDGG